MKPKIKVIQEDTQVNPFSFGLICRWMFAEQGSVINHDRVVVLALAVDTRKWGKRVFRLKKRRQAIRIACNYYRYVMPKEIVCSLKKRRK